LINKELQKLGANENLIKISAGEILKTLKSE
jgi:hypothetical protein